MHASSAQREADQDGLGEGGVAASMAMGGGGAHELQAELAKRGAKRARRADAVQQRAAKAARKEEETMAAFRAQMGLPTSASAE